jgi:hypothetical protein
MDASHKTRRQTENQQVWIPYIEAVSGYLKGLFAKLMKKDRVIPVFLF